MKKTWKKLLAVMLAGVMALSCTVLAGATEPNPNNGVGEVDPTDTGVAVVTTGDAGTAPNTQKVETKYASGGAEGASRSEGPLPADPIRLELPTVTAKTLDMILDPHGLINRTNASRYVVEDGPKVDFKSNTPLYFLNSISTVSGDTTYKYTEETQALTIVNKSHLPVGVDVTLQVDKGLPEDESFDFSFVSSQDELVNAEGAAMYLALKKGSDYYAVADVEDDIIKAPTVEIDDSGDLANAITASIPTAAGTSGYDKAIFQWAKDASNTAATVDVNDEIKQGFIEELGEESTISVTTVNVGTEDDPVYQLKVAAEGIGDYTAVVEPSVIENTTRDVSVAVTYGEEGDDGEIATPVAYVYFVISAGTLADENLTDEYAATLTIVAADETSATAQAKFTDSIDLTKDAYVEAWDDDGGYYWAFTAEQDEDDMEKWGHSDVTAPTSYKSLSFSIVGNINTPATSLSPSPWDGRGGDIKMDLIWDVFEVVGDVTGTAGGSAGGGASGTLPTLAVEPATGTGTSTRTATITWTEGTGTYEGYTPSKVSTDQGDITFQSNSGNTFTIRATTTNKAYTNAKVVFTKADSDDITVDLNGWYTGT